MFLVLSNFKFSLKGICSLLLCVLFELYLQIDKSVIIL
nr:MAG TPA: hypothetical protein [Caudoviricetes sp.]